MITTMSPSSRHVNGRRGVVLIVVLAMLGLLAVIGVTFATYSNQAQIASRRFIANTKANVDPDSMLNYALEQLINDSNNRLSSLRGHSLKRDMYGNDTVFNGLVTSVPNVNAVGFPKPQLPPTITNVSAQLFQDPATGVALARPARLITTNIPVTGTAFDGYDFTRWVLKVAACAGFDDHGRPLNQNPLFLTQTVEVLNGAYHTSMTSGNYRSLLIAEPDLTTGLAQVGQNMFFVLDGRYLRSFNGAGVTHSLVTLANGSTMVQDWGRFPNMRLNMAGTNGLPNGLPANPDLMAAPALDEDYDAADLENWFLALQSADGSITLPSFHRPGIIQYDMSSYDKLNMSTWGSYLLNNDWTVKLPTNANAIQMSDYAASAAKFLRPRAADGHDRTTFPDLVPDLRPTIVMGGSRVTNPTYGQIGSFKGDSTTGYPFGATPDNWAFTPGYDVDNDGDGYKDSVWMDLGFPVQTDANGKKYKPLYAFLVVGLNGRLPLNTAGNLHDRNMGVKFTDPDPMLGWPVPDLNFGKPVIDYQNGGTQNYNHASHLGSSPAEVNPKYALRHSSNLALTGIDRENISTLSLRGLLAGNRNGSTALVGRWGDEKLLKTYIGASGAADPRSIPFNNPVRAGKSALPASSMPAYATPDASDDDADAFDFLATPLPGPTAPQVFSPERSDGTYPSISSNLVLPVERQRRFVTPTDPLGIGHIVAWNRQPAYYADLWTNSPMKDDTAFNSLAKQLGAVSWFGNGPDRYGRVGFFGYYRAPGVSVNEIPPPAASPPSVTVDITRSLLNPTHGYESFRNPLMMNEVEAGGRNGGGFGVGMPYNFGNNWGTGAPTTLPYPFSTMLTVPSNTNPASYPLPAVRGTFTTNIASDNSTINNYLPGVASLGGLMNRDEADEQNLYDESDQFDSPFRASDLADLYLAGSSYDDSSDPIQSRVVNLNGAGEALTVYAKPDPAHFDSAESPEIQQYKRWPVDPRKLFAHESWDTNRFSWANDNPGGSFGAIASPTGNANFLWNQSASSPNMSFNAAGNLFHYPMPSLALGDRRINLNFPLPAYSYQVVDSTGIQIPPQNQTPPSIPRYNEPTRQKWMRETYQLMLRVLPPKAVDTAIEKAQLAQFIVNVVDFRDPDGVMTQFSTLDANTGALGHGLYQTIATSTTPSVVLEGIGPLFTAPANSKPLVLWGMEYNPVALNEAMAYEFQYWGADGKSSSPSSQRRLFIELVNTLTSSNLNLGDVAQPDPADQDMKGWELVMTQDADGSGVADATGRPDPITGQLPTAADNKTILGKVGTQAASRVGVSGVLDTPMPSGKEIKAMRWDATNNSSFPVYSVLANPPASVPVENNPPDTYVAANTKAVYNQAAGYDKLLPPVGTVTEAEKGRYFWLYLLRPADPADPVNSPKVVVDSIRFPYMVSDAKQTSAVTPTFSTTSTHLYSAQRLQPYRGGHAVPNPTTSPYFPLSAYGYSEQTTVSDSSARGDTNTHFIGYKVGTTDTPLVPDGSLRHSLGSTNANREDWSLFQFNDRDFQSVAELLQVPGCGPGQFTKMFVENPPLLGKGRRNPSPPTQPTATADNKSAATAMNYAVALRNEPPTYPYLVDRFYYTGSQQTGYATPMATVTVLPTGTALPTPPNVLIPDPTSGALYGSPSADGWHKMLEFFEVPSSMNGSIGPVTEGENGDWFRQTRVPGKININLIADEEVFLGLVDDWRLNLTELDLVTPTDNVPNIATGHFINLSTNLYEPIKTAMPNRGYINDPTIRVAGRSPAPMKRVFSDFLKLRHGGSGTLLAFGSSTIASPFSGATGTPVARERPYRSLSYPDINDTIMRPAALPPSAYTVPGFNPTTINTNGVGTNRQIGQFSVHNYQVNTDSTAGDPNILALNPITNGYVNNPPYLGDPGIRNIFTDYSFQYAYAQPPAIPFRRIFQIPDAYVGYNAGVKDWDRNSNASLFGNPLINQTISHPNLSTSVVAYNQPDAQSPTYQVYQPASLFVARDETTSFNDLSNIPVSAPNDNPGNKMLANPLKMPRPLLGANIYQTPDMNMGVATGTYTPQSDRRQHPFFRTELLQKVMNLTTVRTQQFAVYVTVGFFEVKKEGNANTLQPDILGAEIDPNNRYTMFAVVDRSKAEGFNPINPGNFRQLVDYSRRLK